MNNKGVFKTKKKDNTEYYRVSITKSGKHISLGSFSNVKDADKCYDSAHKVLNDKAINIDDYDSLKCLSFDKFIVLLNYRDNGMYISNPIYLKKNYFEYYLDKYTVLKFDRDDLFYYSKHKIIKRGNHLFCNEYGNQININERYSIPAYAVKDNDYVFKNKDPYDYRYSNIELINRFHGVRKIYKNGIAKYVTKIHLNGYIKVGEFDDEIVAAVAYNKAADFLKKKHGINFRLNMPDIPAKEYAAIYMDIDLQGKYFL